MLMINMVIGGNEAKGFSAHRADLCRLYCCGSRVSQPLRNKAQQRPAQLKDIDQSAGDIQSLSVFGDAAVSDLGKAEDSLEYQKGMFALGAHARLVTVLALLDQINP